MYLNLLINSNKNPFARMRKSTRKKFAGILGRLFFFCEVGPNWDPRIQTLWPIALYLSFKFIGGYLGVQPPYQGQRSRSASPPLFVLDPSWLSPSSASLPFPTPGIRIEGVPTFPFLHRISRMREYLLFSFCAACIAD